MVIGAETIHVKAWGKTVKELFRNALRGTAVFLKPAVLLTAEKTKKVKHVIRVEAVDINTLLIAFMSKVIALSDIHNILLN